MKEKRSITSASSCVITDSISESSEASTSSANSPEGSTCRVSCCTDPTTPVCSIIDASRCGLSSEMAPNAGDDKPNESFGVIARNFDLRRTNVGES